jgi:hypothetical protein
VIGKLQKQSGSRGGALIMTELNLQEIRLSNGSEQIDSLLKKESGKMNDLSQEECRAESSQCEWQIQKSRIRLVDRVVHRLIWTVFGIPV